MQRLPLDNLKILALSGAQGITIFVSLWGTSLSKELNLHLSLRFVSGLYQVCLRSFSGPSQVFLWSFSGVFYYVVKTEPIKYFVLSSYLFCFAWSKSIHDINKQYYLMPAFHKSMTHKFSFTIMSMSRSSSFSVYVCPSTACVSFLQGHKMIKRLQFSSLFSFWNSRFNSWF